MLVNSLTLSGVNLVFEKWLNQTLYVSYYAKMILWSNGNGPVNKSIHYVIYILLSLLRDHSVTNQ